MAAVNRHDPPDRLVRSGCDVRSPPPGVTADPHKPPRGFPETLDDASRIADHAERWAIGEICRELVEEHFRDCSATLMRLPMEEIGPSDEAGNAPIGSRERRYAAMDPATCPPILVMDGRIEDGHHRHRVALKRRDDGMWCYRVSYPD